MAERPSRLWLRSFLRGKPLLALLLYALPLLGLLVLGMVWLYQNDWLLHFFLLTVALIGLLRLVAWLALRRGRHELQAASALPVEALVQANPDWTDTEAQVFHALQQQIAERLSESQSWDSLPQLALGVLVQAALELRGPGAKALDFSAPEALLLAERMARRLRGDLRHYVPFADTVRLASLHWIWKQRHWLRRTTRAANLAWRLKRVMVNAPVAIAQELQNLLLGEASGVLQASSSCVVQRLLLEEVARAAVDLYSGHLQFSEAELLDIELASRQVDEASQPEVDDPLRIVVVGQVSAGKTSLINALSDRELGETDVVPATMDLVSHHVGVGGLDFAFLDTQGIDGSVATDDLLLKQLMQADLVLWVVRANRPARAPDQALLARMRASYAEQPRRRVPSVIVVITAVDLLLDGWPWPEHQLPPEAFDKLSAVMGAVTRELGVTNVLPVSSESPRWNIDQLGQLLVSEAASALAVQRNRRRLEGAGRAGGVVGEAVRAGRGVLQAGRLAWKGLRRHSE